MVAIRRRRGLLRALLGAFGGLLGGVGATVVLTQSGRVDVEVASSVALGAAVLGAVIGFAEPPRWAQRAIDVAVCAGVIAVGAFGVAPPASAQGGCSVVVSIDGVDHDLGATSRDEPLVVDVGAEPTLTFEASAPGVERGVVEIRIDGVLPPLGPEGDRVVFIEPIVGGSASGRVVVESGGWSGFQIVGDGYRTPIVPLGLAELVVDVVDLDRGATVDGCPENVWVRAVAHPIDNPWGQAGLGATVLGAGLMLVAGHARGRTGGPSEVVAPPPSAGGRPVPPGGPHLDHTDVRIVDDTGAPVDPSMPLVANREYRLAVTFGLGLEAVDDADRAPLSVAAASRSIEVDVRPVVGIPGSPFVIPLVPRRRGRHSVSVDAFHRGHHVQTERIELTIVDDVPDGATPLAMPPGAGQTTTTLISSATPTSESLERLPARQVLVILEADPVDRSVDARIRDEHGDTIVRYDSVLQAAALDEAADGVRASLRDLVAIGGGSRMTLDEGELASGGAAVVAAGQRLEMALFPDARVDQGDVATLRRLVADGATVQIVGHGAGLGYATLPWGLVYDRPFVARAAGNAVCSSFGTHPVDSCPHHADPQVWCPTGFWGVRAVVEELWSSTEHGLRPPPVENDGAASVVYLDDELTATAVQVRATERLGATRLHDFDEMLSWLGTDDDDLGLVFVYAHHDEGSGGGLRVGDDVLTAGTLNAVRAHRLGCWPRRPIVILIGCASGAYRSSAPVSLLEELRAYGAGGAVTTECALWDPVAGECGRRLLDGLAAGRTIGEVLLALRRDLLITHRNPIGLALRLQARADSTASGAADSTANSTAEHGS